MNTTDMLVVEKTAVIEFQGDGGEVMFRLPLKAGLHPAYTVLAVQPPGSEMVVEGDVVIVSVAGRSGRVVSGGKFSSAANQEFVPASLAEQNQRQLLQRLARLERADTLERRKRSAERAMVPKGPDLVEDAKADLLEKPADEPKT